MGDIGPILPVNNTGGGTPPSTPDLQAVTDVGATTDHDLIIGNPSGIHLLLQGNGSPGVFLRNGTTDVAYIDANDMVVFGDPGFWIECYCAGGTAYFVLKQTNGKQRIQSLAVSQDRLCTLPDADSQTVSVLPVTFNGTTGTTLYKIPHGYTFTPSSATVAANNTGGANLIKGGYYLTFDATHINLNLLVATVGTPTVELTFQVTSQI